MPQCPICKAAVWVGERYCATCENYLPHSEEEDQFCPQCSIRVAPQQEICHKCKADLREIAGTPPMASAMAWRHHFRIPGIFIGTGLVIVALFLVFLFKKSPGPPQLAVTPPSQAISEQTPAATPIPTAETAPSAPTSSAAQESADLSTSNPFSASQQQNWGMPAGQESSPLINSPQEPESPKVEYVGSITSNKYHYRNCKWAKTIIPRKTRVFHSVAEAQKAGYIRCPACNPPVNDEPDKSAR